MVERKIEDLRDGSSNLPLGTTIKNPYLLKAFEKEGLLDASLRIWADGKLIHNNIHGESVMQTVEVDKTRLLVTLKENRSKHREIFLDAQEGYRKAVIAELEKMLEEARDNKRIRRSVQLTEPVDQTQDYDAAIAQLEFEINPTVKLSQGDFHCFVLDKWSWKNQFAASNSQYTSKSYDYS